jgi:hypothetical protein
VPARPSVTDAVSDTATAYVHQADDAHIREPASGASWVVATLAPDDEEASRVSRHGLRKHAKGERT